MTTNANIAMQQAGYTFYVVPQWYPYFGASSPQYSPYLWGQACVRLNRLGILGNPNVVVQPYLAIPPKANPDGIPYLFVPQPSLPGTHHIITLTYDFGSGFYEHEMHSQSRKWVSPEVKRLEQLRRANYAREKLCKNSFAWPRDFDIEQHKREYREDVRQHKAKRGERKLEDKEKGVPINKPFGGKTFDTTNRGTVLCFETIFTDNFEINRTDKDYNVKEIADFPCKEEAKYEGDDRISTDRLHGRFLGLPRVPGNQTVNWMQRSTVPQYLFEDFYWPPPTEHEVFWRNHIVDEIEISDEEGRFLIGNELMDMLDE